MQTISGRFRAMHIVLPNGDELIPDIEFAEKLDITRRTLANFDREGCPFVIIGGCKYRPLNEGLAWIASRIQRRNPRRGRPHKAEAQAEGWRMICQSCHRAHD
jgi:hypothetical protein